MKTIDYRNLKHPFLLAPMAEITHCALRELISEFGGCGAYFTEMLSAKGLPHQELAGWASTRRFPGDGPLVYQLLVVNPNHVLPAIEALAPVQPGGLDINMGCSAPIVVNKGGGMALRKDPKQAEAILRAARKGWAGTLSVKTRIGWEHDLDDLRDFCRMARDCGVDAVILHPRLKSEKFKRRARWEVFEEISESCQVAMIGNGDIESASDAIKKQEAFPCSAVMIGRSAVQQPWIFQHIREIREKRPASRIDYLQVWSGFAEKLERYLPEEKRLSRICLFSEYFSRNFSFGHQMWKKVHGADRFDSAVEAGHKFLERIENIPAPR